jgi:hypothetical protein
MTWHGLMYGWALLNDNGVWLLKLQLLKLQLIFAVESELFELSSGLRVWELITAALLLKGIPLLDDVDVENEFKN